MTAAPRRLLLRSDLVLRDIMPGVLFCSVLFARSRLAIHPDGMSEEAHGAVSDAGDFVLRGSLDSPM